MKSRNLRSVVIRPAESRDLKTMVSILNPYIENTAVTFDTQLYTVESRRPWFEQLSSSGRHQCLVAECDGEVIGYANSGSLRPKVAYDTSVEVSVYKELGNKITGVGSRLYAELFEKLKTEDVHRAHAVITLPNPISIRLHENFGFKQVGILNEAGRKFDKYHSICWMEKHL